MTYDDRLAMLPSSSGSPSPHAASTDRERRPSRTCRLVIAAQEEYRRRREAFIDRYELRTSVDGHGLLDVRLQVANERRAVVTLAAHGVSSLDAHLFYASQPPHRMRMSTAG